MKFVEAKKKCDFAVKFLEKKQPECSNKNRVWQRGDHVGPDWCWGGTSRPMHLRLVTLMTIIISFFCRMLIGWIHGKVKSFWQVESRSKLAQAGGRQNGMHRLNQEIVSTGSSHTAHATLRVKWHELYWFFFAKARGKTCPPMRYLRYR